MLDPRLAFTLTPEDCDRLPQFRDLGYSAAYVDATGAHGADQQSALAQLLASLAIEVAGVILSLSDPSASAPAFLEPARRFQTNRVIASLDSNSPLLGDEHDTERERVARLAKSWRAAADRALDASLSLHWLVDWLHPNQSPSVVEQILTAVDRPNFGIAFDTGAAERFAAQSPINNSCDAGALPGAVGLFERFRGFVGTVVLSDESPLQPSAPGPLLPGKGTVDWSRLIPALLDAWLPNPWWLVAPCELRAAEASMRLYLNHVVPLLPQIPAHLGTGAES